MKKLLLAILLMLLTACSSVKNNHFNVVIEGDIDKQVLTSFEGFTLEPFAYKQQDYQGIKLQDLIGDNASKVLLMSNDGAMAKIEGDFSESYLYFDLQYGLSIINLQHPINGNIKDIYRIVIENDDNRKTLMIDDGDVNNYSMIDFYVNQPNISIQDGQSVQNDNQTAVYTKRVTMQLVDEKPYAIFTSDGQQIYDYNGYIQIIDNQFVYVSTNGQRLSDVVGVLYDAPLASISDVYDLVIDYIDDNRVMVIEVDGLGYHMIGNTDLPLKPALSVYPSISNVALASIITGQKPDVTKINQRQDRQLSQNSIFDVAKNKAINAIYIEGETSLIKTSIDAALNLDENGLDGTDDEVYLSTIKAIENDNQLIYSHFHGVDDTAHKYGYDSQKTIDKWQQINDYIDTLIEQFDGVVIIVSDHGHHLTEDGGNHGTIQRNDIIGVLGVIQP